MKNNIVLAFISTLLIVFNSCKGKSDNFVGNWVVCDQPEYSCIITKEGSNYHFHANNGNQDFILEKKADDVLSTISGNLKGSVRFDKPTNHLILIETANKEERRIELCRNSNTDSPVKEEKTQNDTQQNGNPQANSPQVEDQPKQNSDEISIEVLSPTPKGFESPDCYYSRKKGEAPIFLIDYMGNAVIKINGSIIKLKLSNTDGDNTGKLIYTYSNSSVTAVLTTTDDFSKGFMSVTSGQHTLKIDIIGHCSTEGGD